MTSARFIICSIHIKLGTFFSGPIFYNFSEILSILLSTNKNILIFQFLFLVWISSNSLPLYLYISSGHTPPSRCVSFLSLLHVFLPAFLLLGKVLDLSFSFYQKKTRVIPSLQENYTLWYFGLAFLCLLSQTLHASIHGGSLFFNHCSFFH
jgi:hypothetical protein